MEDKDRLHDEEEKYEYYYEDEEAKKRVPTFLLLCLITTFGVLIALGLSLSAVQLLGSNETINTLISSIKGDDNKDKYIITYVENTGDYSKDSVKDGGLYISSAKFLRSTNGGSGVVTYYGGLMVTTKTTFKEKSSTVTYQIVIKNDSSISKTFHELFYNKDGNVKYTLSGIKDGDVVAAGKSVTAYLTVEYTGSRDKFPETVESSLNLGFQKNGGGIYIDNAEFYKGTGDATGTVTYYGGLTLTTKTKFPSKSSTVTYEITLKNSSSESEIFTGINYNQEGNVKYTLTGINEGDTLTGGESKVVYLTVEYIGPDDTFPKTIESTTNFNVKKADGGIYIEKAEFYKGTGDATGTVTYYGGLMLTTKTKFPDKSSTVTYEITLKNSSPEAEKFTGIKYNQEGNVKYTLSGIDNGYIFSGGESKVVYLIVEYIGVYDPEGEIESSISFDFIDFGVSTEERGIYLINQFPTKDEVGKLFQGKNYVFNFALLVGKKTAGAYYELTAVENNDNTLNPSFVKLYLEKNGEGVDMSYRANNRVKVFTEYQKSEHAEAVGRVIYKGYVTEEDAKVGKIDFVMRMWVSEDVVLDNETAATYFNKIFGVKVNTYAMFER